MHMGNGGANVSMDRQPLSRLDPYTNAWLRLSLLRHVITMRYLGSRLETYVGPSLYAAFQGLVFAIVGHPKTMVHCTSEEQTIRSAVRIGIIKPPNTSLNQ